MLICDSFDRYLKEISNLELLTPEEERELTAKNEQGDPEARQALIKGNLRLVISQAMKYRNCGVPLYDLIQEGNIGLMEAARRFKTSRNTKFSTYAVLWIQRYFEQAIPRARTIPIERHAWAQIQKIRKTHSEIVRTEEREPSLEEISAATKINLKRVTELWTLAVQPESLDRPKKVESDDGMFEYLAHPKGIDETIQDSVAQTTVIWSVLETLPERERFVINHRFGFCDCEQLSLEEIGHHYGVTREMIRIIEKRALQKIRELLEGENFEALNGEN